MVGKKKPVTNEPAPANPLESSPTNPDDAPPVEQAPASPPTGLADTSEDNTEHSDEPEEVYAPTFDLEIEGQFRESIPLDEVVSLILAGKLGNYHEARALLIDSGYDSEDASAIQYHVNRRLAGGAPSAYRVSVKDVATQWIRGEWGSMAKERKHNVEAVGYNFAEIQAEVKRQLGK